MSTSTNIVSGPLGVSIALPIAFRCLLLGGRLSITDAIRTAVLVTSVLIAHRYLSFTASIIIGRQHHNAGLFFYVLGLTAAFAYMTKRVRSTPDTPVVNANPRPSFSRLRSLLQVCALLAIAACISPFCFPYERWGSLPYSPTYDALVLGFLYIVSIRREPGWSTARAILVMLVLVVFGEPFLEGGAQDVFATKAIPKPASEFCLALSLVLVFLSSNLREIAASVAPRYRLLRHIWRTAPLHSTLGRLRQAVVHSMRVLLPTFIRLGVLGLVITQQTIWSAGALFVTALVLWDVSGPRRTRALLMTIACIILALAYWGAYHPLEDNLLLGIGAVVLLFIQRKSLRTGIREKLGRLSWSAATIIAVWWLLVPVVDFAVHPHGPRLSKERRRQHANRAYAKAKIAVALSGGGYRAALMHAGVLAALDEFGFPVTHAVSVSGGSIIGSFYATGGDPEYFRDLVGSGAFDLRRHILYPHNLVRLLFPLHVPRTHLTLFPWYLYSRSELQADLLDSRLLGGVTFARAQKQDSSAQLMLCATDLYSGMAAGIVKDGVLFRTPLKIRDRYDFENRPATHDLQMMRYIHSAGSFPAQWRLSRLVTASGAFPGAFNSLVADLHDREEGIDRTIPLQLADGGVSDNFGIPLLLEAQTESAQKRPERRIAGPDTFTVRTKDSRWYPLSGWKVDLALASDASAFFSTDRHEEDPYGEFVRALDIIYNNVRPRDPPGTAVIPPLYLLSPQIIIEARPHNFSEALFQAVGSDVAMAVRLPQPRKFMMHILPTEQEVENRYRWYQSAYWRNLIEKGVAENGRQAQAASAGPKKESPSNVEADVQTIIERELQYCIDAFTRMSTLDDRPTMDEARAVYRLGQYLVALNFESLDVYTRNVLMQNKLLLELWGKLREALPDTAITVPEPTFAEERALALLFTIEPIRGNGPLLTAMDALRTVIEDETKIPKRFPELRAMQAASLAHRLAHAVIEARSSDHLPYTDSLLDEVRNNVYVPEALELTIDEMTIDVLRRAGENTNGGEALMRNAISKFGTDGVHLDVKARLQHWHSYAKQSTQRYK